MASSCHIDTVNLEARRFSVKFLFLPPLPSFPSTIVRKKKGQLYPCQACVLIFMNINWNKRELITIRVHLGAMRKFQSLTLVSSHTREERSVCVCFKLHFKKSSRIYGKGYRNALILMVRQLLFENVQCCFFQRLIIWFIW